MATLKDRLDSYPNQPEQGWAKRKHVSVGEKGQTYQVVFSPEQLTAVYSVDGGIVNDKNVMKCDKLILVKIVQERWFGKPPLDSLVTPI